MRDGVRHSQAEPTAVRLAGAAIGRALGPGGGRMGRLVFRDGDGRRWSRQWDSDGNPTTIPYLQDGE